MTALETCNTNDTDISIYLPDIQVAWQQGILNASDAKEIKKILLNSEYHHLLSTPLLRFVESFKQQSEQHNQHNNDEKKRDNEAVSDEIVDIEQEIRIFQASIRPSIQKAILIQLSHTNSLNNSTQILNKLMENRILSKDILYLIEKSILSISISNVSRKTLHFSQDKCITIEECYNLIDCDDDDDDDNMDNAKNTVTMRMIEDVLNEEILIYKECVSLLTDEINTLKSIFSAEHDEIAIHSHCYPVIIELCLLTTQTHKYGKLYLTFLCPIDYPLKSCIKSSIYFNGPTDFATNNEIWFDLQIKLHGMAQDAIGEQHLFDMVQFGKEWLEKYEERYVKQETTNKTQKYIELRTALGLIDKNDKNVIIAENGGKMHGVEGNGKTYVWYWKDINRNWNEYPENMQLKMNNLGIHDGTLSFSSNNYNYAITKTSQAKGIQTNCDSNAQSPVKRKIRKLPNYCDELLRIKQMEQKQKQKEIIRKEQRMTQCYSSWEIDETIFELIKRMSAKWKCNKSQAMAKLAENLWTSHTSIDKQLQHTRTNQDIYVTAAGTDTDTEEIKLCFPVILEFECPICLELKSMFNGIRIHCSHIICIECLSNYIFNQIDNGITVIKCPQYQCKTSLANPLIHILSDNITYKRYRQFLQNSFLETRKDWKFCPNPQCCSAIRTKRDIALLVCNCGIPLCTSCVDKFHWPLKCVENKRWSLSLKTKLKISDPLLPDLPTFEGQKYTMLVKTKECPKCKTWWEKNGGCNHIHCRKCKYHFCWVCLKEFNSATHDDFYECKQGYVANTKQQTFVMEEPTERYVNAYKNVVQQRKQIREQHDEKLKKEVLRKARTKKAIQHERASIFLQEKYLKKAKKLRILLKNVILSTEKNNEKIPKKLDMEFIGQLIARMVETHLLLSRAYKYISYHSINEKHTICNILKSLEHVAFKLDAMFQEPKVYLQWTQCRWKWYDLGFYIEFFIQEMIKICNPKKQQESKNYYIDQKPKKHNPFMKVCNHQY